MGGAPAKCEHRLVPVSVTCAGKLFTVRASGEVTFDEVRDMIDRILAHDGLREGAAFFIDNRGVTKTPSIAEVAVITSHFAKVFARGATRVALLADHQVAYRVSQIFAAFASTVGGEARAFDEEEKARAWLVRP